MKISFINQLKKQVEADRVLAQGMYNEYILTLLGVDLEKKNEEVDPDSDLFD